MWIAPLIGCTSSAGTASSTHGLPPGRAREPPLVVLQAGLAVTSGADPGEIE